MIMASVDNSLGLVSERKERCTLQCASSSKEKKSSCCRPFLSTIICSHMLGYYSNGLRTDWDMLFQPLFDELLTPPPSFDYPTPEVIAPIAKVVSPEPAESTGSPSSTTVD
uniref:Uncharacterized protein n=1 Tax=Tanacetum cinerariifolium TaxID=118510 RepID=A0A699QPF7_TANCI|nr:hypothetical protein [Tanacetum cinerariifolium]